MTSPARRAALRVLRDVHSGRRDLPTAQTGVRAELEDSRDRALATEIVLGTLRWRAQLDHVISQVSTRPISRIDADVLDLLRLSTYQLLHLNRIPARAVVNDAVRLTRNLGVSGKHSAASFVNALLRSVAQKRTTLALPAPSRVEYTDRTADLEYLSVTMSHPRWLVERWYDRVGFDATERWTRFNNMSAPITLHVNTMTTSVGAVTETLRQHGIRVEAGHWARHALVVRKGYPLTAELHDGNLFWIQDEASQLVAELVDANPGARVLDACASPGGKSLVVAGTMTDRGLLVSADRSPARTRVLRDTLMRVGIRCAHVIRHDARRPPFGPVFDWVVIDAPCSGLGTIRRDPDIRWRRQPEDLARMSAMQAELMTGGATAVKPGGHLLYATCSTEPEENQEVVRGFLDERPDFAVVSPTVTARHPALVDDAGFFKTHPYDHGLEGFFAAVLGRTMP